MPERNVRSFNLSGETDTLPEERERAKRLFTEIKNSPSVAWRLKVQEAMDILAIESQRDMLQFDCDASVETLLLSRASSLMEIERCLRDMNDHLNLKR